MVNGVAVVLVQAAIAGHHRLGGFNKHLFLPILEVQVHSADSSGSKESWVPGFQMLLHPPAVESREEELALASSYKALIPS